MVDYVGAMIDQLFEPPVITFVATPEMWNAPLHAAEEACIVGVAPKRRREFTAGRACARRALEHIGIRGFPLVCTEDRLAAWPSGVVGSITHTAGYCGVAVARTGVIAGLGLDAEEAGALDPAIVPLVCSAAELTRPNRGIADDAVDLAKLIFSAKESTYKCYYPITRRFIEFLDVEVILGPGRGEFTAEFRGELSGVYRGLGVLKGRYAVSSTHVLTGATLFNP